MIHHIERSCTILQGNDKGHYILKTYQVTIINIWMAPLQDFVSHVNKQSQCATISSDIKFDG